MNRIGIRKPPIEQIPALPKDDNFLFRLVLRPQGDWLGRTNPWLQGAIAKYLVVHVRCETLGVPINNIVSVFLSLQPTLFVLLLSPVQSWHQHLRPGDMQHPQTLPPPSPKQDFLYFLRPPLALPLARSEP